MKASKWLMKLIQNLSAVSIELTASELKLKLFVNYIKYK